MNGLTAFLEKYFVPVAAKIGSQKTSSCIT